MLLPKVLLVASCLAAKTEDRSQPTHAGFSGFPDPIATKNKWGTEAGTKVQGSSDVRDSTTIMNEKNSDAETTVEVTSDPFDKETTEEESDTETSVDDFVSLLGSFTSENNYTADGGATTDNVIGGGNDTISAQNAHGHSAGFEAIFESFKSNTLLIVLCIVGVVIILIIVIVICIGVIHEKHTRKRREKEKEKDFEGENDVPPGERMPEPPLYGSGPTEKKEMQSAKGAMRKPSASAAARSMPEARRPPSKQGRPRDPEIDFKPHGELVEVYNDGDIDIAICSKNP
ncbi:hypothetical protein GCK32_002025 [Trichostrongylus colubriformis]|uniref:Uncharacterized protein n=1 Tax=Trichostrongylus colubriformis TaxID=6319 RepID=A0AAN8EVS6_TRICO